MHHRRHTQFEAHVCSDFNICVETMITSFRFLTYSVGGFGNLFFRITSYKVYITLV